MHPPTKQENLPVAFLGAFSSSFFSGPKRNRFAFCQNQNASKTRSAFVLQNKFEGKELSFCKTRDHSCSNPIRYHPNNAPLGIHPRIQPFLNSGLVDAGRAMAPRTLSLAERLAGALGAGRVIDIGPEPGMESRGQRRHLIIRLTPATTPVKWTSILRGP